MQFGMDPYGLPVALLVHASGVSLDTARRWKRQGRIPPLAARLVAFWAEGDLGAIDPAWRGFTLRGAELWTPYQFAVSPGEISAIPYRRAQLVALEREREIPLQRDLFAGSSYRREDEDLQPHAAETASRRCRFLGSRW